MAKKSRNSLGKGGGKGRRAGGAEGGEKKTSAPSPAAAALTGRGVAEELLRLSGFLPCKESLDSPPWAETDPNVVDTAVKRLLGARSPSPVFNSLVEAVAVYGFLTNIGILGLTVEDVPQLLELSSHLSKVPDAKSEYVALSPAPIREDRLGDTARYGIVGSHNVRGGLRYTNAAKGHSRAIALAKEVVIAGERLVPLDVIHAAEGKTERALASALLDEGIELKDLKKVLSEESERRDARLRPSSLLKLVLEPGETREKALLASAAVISRLSQLYGAAYEVQQEEAKAATEEATHEAIPEAEPKKPQKWRQSRGLLHPKAVFGTIGCGGSNPVNCGSLVGNIGGQVRTLKARLPLGLYGIRNEGEKREDSRQLSLLFSSLSQRRSLVELWRLMKALGFDDYWKEGVAGKSVTRLKAEEFRREAEGAARAALASLISALPLIRRTGVTEGDLRASGMGATEAAYLAGGAPGFAAEALAGEISTRVGSEARRRGETVFGSLVAILCAAIQQVLQEGEEP